ncbi:MAG: serine/threonine protein kinase [Pirellulales bacterium]|nr:serine/threonine protein kinase [Pirellulales bacterium]
MSQNSDRPKSDDAADLSGRRLGDFQLLRRLGRGAMAEVYLAEQCSLKRRVALKILKADHAADPTYLQRFTIEAQAAAALVHANIVQIYEVGKLDGWHYIAQEYVQGLNLREWLQRNGPPHLPQALSIMRQVAAALAKAGEHGVVHRDIKPENIMITAEGEVKVADFGLARHTRSQDGPQLTEIGITLGTPLYMSPEQVEGKPLDPRSDLYSFGVTCYQMLAGTPPFTGDTALAVAVQHVKTPPRPLTELRADLPPALCQLVHSLLEKDPRQRCPSARELLRNLRQLWNEFVPPDWQEGVVGWETVGETAPSPHAAVTEHLEGLMKTLAVDQPSRRLRYGVIAGAAAAFLLGVFLAWLTVVKRPLLADAQIASSSFPKESNVHRQWLLASKWGTAEAWQSIERYFPKKTYYVLHAKQQLALLYLQEGDYGRALNLFEQLAQATYEPIRAFGLAGWGSVLCLQGKNQESSEVLQEFWQIHGKLQNGRMKQLLEKTIQQNRSKLGSLPNSEDWDQYLRSLFKEESEEPEKTIDSP